MMERFDAIEKHVKAMQNNFSRIGQKVDAHEVSIKQLEQQFSEFSSTVNPRQPGTLPSNTIQNPKNDYHFRAVTTRRGKHTIDPLMPSKIEIVVEKNADEIEVTGKLKNSTEKEAEVTQKVVFMPRFPSPFPQR
uniref:Integrase core domain containing protein n=1 Tax=Solanum tuberosum TaxID=4113 RepID=M1DEJ1_SOLTU